jgi:hypothetical protein
MAARLWGVLALLQRPQALNIHKTRNTSYGEDNRGEPGIDGKMRTVANPKGQI